MTTFTIDPENNITAHPREAEAVSAASGESFASQEALDTLTASWPMDRFVTVWYAHWSSQETAGNHR